MLQNGELSGSPDSAMISIVTPSLNQALFLTHTIESVLLQNTPPSQHWVIDGGSDDGTVNILRGYSPSVQWLSEPDRGQADAVNKGVRLSRGKILGWLNADDLYLPETIQTVLQEFESDPKLMLLYGKANHIDNKGLFLERYPTRNFYFEALAYQCFICQPACFFRRELWETVGGLDVNLHYALDLDLWIRFGKLLKTHPEWNFKHIPQLLALSRMYSDNKTLRQRSKSYQETIEVVRTHFGVVPFNLIYGLLESRNSQHDGFFSRSPFSLPLFCRSILCWCWQNLKKPAYIFRHLAAGLFSPAQSYRRISSRVRNRFPSNSISD